MPGFDASKLVIIAGMPRGGTTSLYHIIDGHPHCFVPFRKETAYFSYNYAKGEKWYRRLFAERPSDAVGFDISPQYFMDLRSIARIKELAPSAKVILSVRDPVDWIVSLYFQINKFERKPSFSSFVDGFTVTGAHETLHCAFADGYVRRSVEAFRAAFGPNLLIFSFELFRRDPLTVLTAIEKFAGVEHYFTQQTFQNVKVNSVTQYNWRWLTWLASREAFISTLDALLPRSLIREGRTLVDRLTMPKADQRQVHLCEADLEIAKARLGHDREWVKALLARAPIQLGDGCSFLPSHVAAAKIVRAATS